MQAMQDRVGQGYTKRTIDGDHLGNEGQPKPIGQEKTMLVDSERFGWRWQVSTLPTARPTILTKEEDKAKEDKKLCGIDL